MRDSLLNRGFVQFVAEHENLKLTFDECQKPDDELFARDEKNRQYLIMYTHLNGGYGYAYNSLLRVRKGARSFRFSINGQAGTNTIQVALHDDVIYYRPSQAEVEAEFRFLYGEEWTCRCNKYTRPVRCRIGTELHNGNDYLFEFVPPCD